MKEVKDGKPVSNQRGKNKPKEKRIAELVAAMDTPMKEDGLVTIRELSAAFGVSFRTVHMIERGFQFHWDNAPVHTAVAVKD